MGIGVQRKSELSSLLCKPMSLWSGYAVWVLPTVQLYVANFAGVILPLTYLFFFALHSRGAARARLAAEATTSRLAGCV